METKDENSHSLSPLAESVQMDVGMTWSYIKANSRSINEQNESDPKIIGGKDIINSDSSITNSTEPFPRIDDSETLTSWADVDYVIPSDQNFTSLGERQNINHGRTPSISQRRFWHLPSTQAAEESSGTLNAEQSSCTQRSANQKNRDLETSLNHISPAREIQNWHPQAKRTRSLMHIRRPHRGSNIWISLGTLSTQ